MKYLTVALAACCAILAAALTYTAIPDKAEAPKPSAAYQRIDTMLRALQRGDYKTACSGPLEWWAANLFITEQQCEVGMQATFPKGKMVYRMLGDVRGRSTYHVVTAAIVTDDPTTKVDETAVCETKWADGLDCKYEGIYTFGTALQVNVKDAIAGTKHAPKQWYAFWID